MEEEDEGKSDFCVRYFLSEKREAVPNLPISLTDALKDYDPHCESCCAVKEYALERGLANVVVSEGHLIRACAN